MKKLLSARKKMVFVVANLMLVACLAAVGLLAKAMFAQRDFSGNIRLELCQADANGKWRIIDTIDATTNFAANVTELAAGNEVMTRFVWNGTSAKGRRVSVRLARAGRSAFDLKSGKLELMQMPFEVTVDGQKEMVTYNLLTTESTEGADGMISGKRAQVSNGAATLAMVGTAKLRTDKLSAGQATIGKIKKVEDFLVVVKANGRLVTR